MNSPGVTTIPNCVLGQPWVAWNWLTLWNEEVESQGEWSLQKEMLFNVYEKCAFVRAVLSHVWLFGTP